MQTSRIVKLLFPCILLLGLTGCWSKPSQTTSPVAPDKKTLQEALRGHFQLTMPQQNTNDLQITFIKALGHGAYVAMYLFHDQKHLPHYGAVSYVVSSKMEHTLQWKGYSDSAPSDSQAKYTFYSSQSNVDAEQTTVPCQFFGGLVNDPSIKEIIVLYDDGKTMDAKIDPVSHTFAVVRTDVGQNTPEPKATFAVDADWKEVAHTPPVPPAKS